MRPVLAAVGGAAVLALRLAGAEAAPAKADARLLEPGRPIERPLAAGEEHPYEIQLRQGEFIRVAIDQRGIDVISTLYDPAGKQLVLLDGPTGILGVETLWFVAAGSGIHRIVVRAYSKHSAPGRYEIRLVERRPASDADRLKDRACRLQSLAFTLQGVRSVETFGRAAALWHTSGEVRDEATCVLEQANAAQGLGDLRTAVAAAEKAIVLAGRAGDPQLESKVRVSLGRALAYQGEYAAGLGTAEPAIAIARRLGDLQSLSDSLHVAAWALYAMGRFQEALDRDREALSAADAIGDQLDQAWALNGLGNSYAAVGQATLSLSAFDRSIELFRALDYSEGLAFSLQSAGYLAWKIGAERRALSLYRESLPLAVTAGNRLGEAFARNNIGLALLTLGDLDPARKELTAALALWKEVGETHGRALTLHNLARVLERQGDRARAHELFEQSLSLFRSSGDRSGEARVLATMAEADLEEGRLDAALSRIEESLGIFDALGRRLATPSLRSAFISSRQDAYGIAVDVLARLDAERPGRGYAERAFQASERSRARELVESITEARLDLASELPEDLKRREADLLGRLVSLEKEAVAEGGLRPETEGAITRAEEDWDSLVAEMRRRTPRYAAVRYPEPVRWEKARSLLGSASAIVSFEVLKSRTLAFVLSSAGLRIAEIPMTSARLSELVESCVGLMSRVDAVGFEGIGRRLSSEVVRPWRSVLPPGIERVVLVPEGPLLALPFEALPDPGSAGRRLLDSLTISYAPSVTVLRELSRSARGAGGKPSDMLVFAAPALSPALSRGGAEIDGESYDLMPLAAAEQEGLAVARHGGDGTVLRTGLEASEEQFKREPLERFGVLHFATHGVVSSVAPSRSALVLAAPSGRKEDGFLQAREIYGLRLKSDLVVLSACQTARGKILPGEGMQGLARAFFHAGAATLVASLWDVSDRRTADLMEAFYGHMAAGQAKAEALRSAKLDLLRREPDLAARFWAPFILIGEPAATVPLRPVSWWRRLFG